MITATKLIMGMNTTPYFYLSTSAKQWCVYRMALLWRLYSVVSFVLINFYSCFLNNYYTLFYFL